MNWNVKYKPVKLLEKNKKSSRPWEILDLTPIKQTMKKIDVGLNQNL